MHIVAPLFCLILAATCVRASHSHFEIIRRHGQHTRLARRAHSPNGRCGVKTAIKANANASQAPSNVTVSSVNLKSSNQSLPSPILGLIDVESTCGPIGATRDVTPTSGPNGNIDWLNCGVSDGGWSPPYVTLKDIITQDLASALQIPGSPFTACAPYVALFELYAGQHGIPAILVAAIAMQESTCNAQTIGGAGEQGLMQLTQDKCDGAPNGDCKDPDYNIRTGVEFFSATLQNNGGSLLLTIGNYNGWPLGMTFGSATAAANGPCCRCQNNLDYLHQLLNGWLQGINPYTHNPRIGKYFNLDRCKA
ncbi:glycoside hydrolase family 23 protein [Wolfiporia cocos MD-104 SS10]|uniref:Glycoside hydrolase family 23 protein n=1 Tax=Wolfiporia cocos (strain MD-104) TaxID=742152 RepID=A0A2H3J2P7_WOLCO|nr:glycoside hydrolase family 23 protein [Wolfiporia cocos MD-104 SS10]